MTAPPTLVLASASPRRADILRQLGLEVEVHPAHVDEAYLDGEEPSAHVERLAREKAETGARVRPGAWVGGGVLGKPVDADDAARMLLELAGSDHEVLSGVALTGPHGTLSSLGRTAVRFRAFDEGVARQYVATGEPLDRTLEAQDLLDEPGHEGQVAANPILHVGVSGEQPHAMVQRARRRLEPTGYELVHEVLQLGDGQRLDALLVLVGVHERRDEIVGRLRTPGLEDGSKVMLRLELDLDRLQDLVGGQRAHRERKHGPRPAVEAMDFGAVEAQLLGDDDPRKRHREVEVELALPTIDQLVDQPAGDVIDMRRHVGDAARKKRLRLNRRPLQPLLVSRWWLLKCRLTCSFEILQQ